MIDKFEKYNTRAGLRSFASQKDFEDDLANKAYAYYKKDTSAIHAYLFNYLSTIINERSLARMQMVTVNYVPKIIKRLTMLYKTAPTVENVSDNYFEYNLNLNYYRKEVHRLSKLMNTILIRPIWDEGKFRFMILHRGICDVITDAEDWFKMKELRYNVIKKVNGEEKIVRMIWTSETLKQTDLHDNVLSVEKNIYNRIPFIVVRLEESADFWGDGQVELVLGNEALNARITDDYNKKYLEFGIPIGINLGVEADQFYIAPDMPFMINNVRQDMQQPSLTFATPDHKIESSMGLNDWYVKALSIASGLPPSSFSQNETALSGYAKTIDNLELIDLNNDDKPAMKRFEFELFELENLILKKEGVKEMSGKLSINFSPIEFPKTNEEIISKRKFDAEYNISTPAQWLAEDKGISVDEADEVIRNNKQANSETIGQTKGLFTL